MIRMKKKRCVFINIHTENKSELPIRIFETAKNSSISLSRLSRFTFKCKTGLSTERPLKLLAVKDNQSGMGPRRALFKQSHHQKAILLAGLKKKKRKKTKRIKRIRNIPVQLRLYPRLVCVVLQLRKN